MAMCFEFYVRLLFSSKVLNVCFFILVARSHFSWFALQNRGSCVRDAGGNTDSDRDGEF